jgi:phosphoglycolate phosphatase-like HAD superfamily hydrolase
MKDSAIAFDFDGTLVHSGNDKCVHIMYAGYVACATTEFRRFLHPDNPDHDVDRLLRGLLRYPGAPRFQQLAALVNSLIHDQPVAVEAPAGLGLEPELAGEYASVRRTYDAVYTALNDAAAAKFWKAYPVALETLPRLAADFDLYVASGVPQDILENDVVRHGYDRRLFQGIWGANRQGAADKAEILKRITARGYRDILFVGDANRDLEYAQAAGVKFFRVRVPEDFPRLAALVPHGFPNQTEPWAWTDIETDFFRSTTRRLVEACLAGHPLSPADATDAIHERWDSTQ